MTTRTWQTTAPTNRCFVAERDGRIVGVLPGAFRDAQKGFVDAVVMFRSLVDD